MGVALVSIGSLAGRKIRLFARAFTLLAICSAVVFSAAGSAAQTGLVLPPGTIVEGTVYNNDGTSVASVTTGADANTLIHSTPPTASFVAGDSAAVVITSAPTTYVRVYTEGVTQPNRAFIAGSNVIRGLSPEEIKDVLALPYVPDMLTIVAVPAGTCVMTGTGAAINGDFPANPPAIPVAGPWGNGGAAQSYLIGTSSDPNCKDAQFLPAENYMARQPIGVAALAYAPHAGRGNTAAVAYALDHANPFPVLFSDMDGIYNTLDLLNFAGPRPLQYALTQLGGEIYADTASAAIAAGQLFLAAMRDQVHRPLEIVGKVLPWASAIGAGGSLSGNGDSHDLRIGFGGLALGFDYGIDPTARIGIAAGYTRGSYSTIGVSGNGATNSYSIAAYGSYSPGPVYIEGAIGYAYNEAQVTRGINFPGVRRAATGAPSGNALLTGAETGYRVDLDPATRLTPFAAIEAVAFFQSAFAETGAGAIDLNVSERTTSSARGILGGEIKHTVSAGLPAPLELTGRLAWAYEFLPTDRSATAFMDGIPGAFFTVNGASAARNAVLFALGANVKTPSGELFARYSGSAAKGQFIQGGTIGGRWSF
jgi:hypothetical protein